MTAVTFWLAGAADCRAKKLRWPAPLQSSLSTFESSE